MYGAMIESFVHLLLLLLLLQVRNSKTKQHKVIKLCKNVDNDDATRLHIFIVGSLI